jgi:hypothetical protein
VKNHFKVPSEITTSLRPFPFGQETSAQLEYYTLDHLARPKTRGSWLTTWLQDTTVPGPPANTDWFNEFQVVTIGYNAI